MIRHNPPEGVRIGHNIKTGNKRITIRQGVLFDDVPGIVLSADDSAYALYQTKTGAKIWDFKDESINLNDLINVIKKHYKNINFNRIEDMSDNQIEILKQKTHDIHENIIELTRTKFKPDRIVKDFFVNKDFQEELDSIEDTYLSNTERLAQRKTIKFNSREVIDRTVPEWD
ncbi:MAG: hypothetical protein H7831_16220 [Magnetococcus sp. WYHC-3]